MGLTPRPNPFIPIKADKVEHDEFNTWEKFYKDDKENIPAKDAFMNRIKGQSNNLSVGEYVKPKWPKTRTVKE